MPDTHPGYAMRRTNLLVFCATLLVAFCIFLSGAAEAKRLGGGSSFGGSPSYSRPASPPPSSPGFAPGGSGATQQTAPGPASPGTMRRPGFGGFGGLFFGGLIGSMFFGHPFGGVGLFDILLIGLGIWMLFRIIGRMRGGGGDSRWGNNVPGGLDDDGADNPTYGRDARYRAAEQAWDALRDQGPRPVDTPGAPKGTADVAAGVDVPPGFDIEEFMKGAKIVYARLQEAWSRRDLDDIREFTTPGMFGEIQRQAREDPDPMPTDVLVINARLMEVKTQGRVTTATVYYEVTMREDRALATTEQVREVWTFTREGEEMWKLDGIQQIEQ